MNAKLHVLLAMVVCLALALLYVKYLEPLYPASEAGRQIEQHLPGVSGRGAIYDEADYLEGARNIAEGRGYSLDSQHPTAIRQPLYSMYLAAFFRAFGGANSNTALLANACALTLLPLFAFLIAETLFGHKAAIVAAYLCVLDPALYFFGAGWVYSEALFAVLLCGGMAFWLHARREGFAHRTLASTAAGLLFGAAALTRSGFLVFPVLLCLVEIFFRRWRNVRAAMVLCAAAFLCVAPWAARNQKAFGTRVISCTNDGITLLGSALAAADGHGDWKTPALVSPQYAALEYMPDEVARNRQARALAWARLKTVPLARLARVMLLRVARTWVPYTRLLPDEIGLRLNLMLTALFFPDMLFGLIGARRMLTDRKQLYSAIPILLTMAYVTALSAAAWGSTRFRMPLEPMLTGFAAAGLIWGWNRAAGLVRTRHPSSFAAPAMAGDETVASSEAQTETP